MSSEPSERARAWAERFAPQASVQPAPRRELAYAFDAGHSEGEKKGTAVGYLAALREVKEYIRVNTGSWGSPSWIEPWLDRRIREAEGQL